MMAINPPVYNPMSESFRLARHEDNGVGIQYHIATPPNLELKGTQSAIQSQAEKFLGDLGAGSFLSEPPNENWNERHVTIAPELLHTLSRQAGLQTNVPGNLICATVLNALRVRAGLRPLGSPSSFVPAIKEDLTTHAARVSVAEARVGDVALTDVHAGIVVQLSDGTKRVLAFTGDGQGKARAQLIPLEFGWTLYHVRADDRARTIR